jgi:hypothetical protein
MIPDNVDTAKDNFRRPCRLCSLLANDLFGEDAGHAGNVIVFVA